MRVCNEQNCTNKLAAIKFCNPISVSIVARVVRKNIFGILMSIKIKITSRICICLSTIIPDGPFKVFLADLSIFIHQILAAGIIWI